MRNLYHIDSVKARFIGRYNVEKSVNTAARMAIGAAVKRNPTYRVPYNQKLRGIFRDEWQNRLKAFAVDPALFGNVNDTFAVVRQFRDCIRHLVSERSHQMPEVDFRISHAQKSISVYLKHLWCMGLAPQPAVCPVDRIIMTAAKAPYALRSWGQVDCIDHHKSQVDYLVDCAAKEGLPLAIWELYNFTV